MIEQLKQDRMAQILLAITVIVACVGFFLVGGVLIVVLGDNNADESPVVAQSPPTELPVPTQTATQVVEATDTVTPTPKPPTPEPTTPPTPTLPPPSDYQEPFILLEYSAVGEMYLIIFRYHPVKRRCLIIAYKHRTPVWPH
jgi:hypothetical protein